MAKPSKDKIRLSEAQTDLVRQLLTEAGQTGRKISKPRLSKLTGLSVETLDALSGVSFESLANAETLCKAIAPETFETFLEFGGKESKALLREIRAEERAAKKAEREAAKAAKAAKKASKK